MTFDYQTVTPVSITQSLVDGVEGADKLLAYIARVSNPKNQQNHETASKLLNYCMRNAHWSVFEQVNVGLEIVTTRDIARQILRHRSFCFQEFSQRYADPTEDLGFVKRQIRLQDPKNRQNSILVTADNGMKFQWEIYQDHVIRAVLEGYKWAIENGMAKEQARALMPEGLTLSRMYVNGTLRSWIHFCNVRRGNGTQLEHIDVANKCWDEINNLFKGLLDD